ncbi:MAG: FAD-dependent oxidoreductase, partial [Elusimicrobiota bacterium]
MSENSIVIGAGPAGLSAGIGLLKAKHQVKILEQRPEWKERVCGCFLSAEATHHLKFLGIKDPFSSTEAVLVHSTKMTFQYEGKKGEKLLTHTTPGIGISRRSLETLLEKRFIELGGILNRGQRVINMTQFERWNI